ncbi:MAG: PilZ domain-containing protein [Bdellovibrionaceae bacterium]|nr:PilZ domain-containing protein [Pseudobdellovibrionaceae bacterium]MBX3034301.1 PilZ domain-containing protein [Pseudobdellovibrionaceae bacterium]
MMSDTSKKWFLLQAGQIQGPWTPEEIENKLPGASDPLVWGRGLSEWLPPEAWRSALLSSGTVLTESIAMEHPHWRYRLGEREFGPYNYPDLIDVLKKISDFTDVEILNDTGGGWREVYDIQKIVDELGITRRAHQRVPIMGTLKLDLPAGGHAEAKVISISEGGLGVHEFPRLSVGEKIKGVLRSANLFMDIPCSCEVVYVSHEGSAGLRFLHLPMEAQAAVVEYVNKFRDLGDR